MPTKIKSCGCKPTTLMAQYQDERYGKDKRVHNAAKGPNNTVTWRCTGCGRES